MVNQFKAARVRAWIVGLARPPAVPTSKGESGALGYYHPTLEPIGESVNVWRLRKERDRDYAFRIAVEIAAQLNRLDADLDRVINYDKGW